MKKIGYIDSFGNSIFEKKQLDIYHGMGIEEIYFNRDILPMSVEKIEPLIDTLIKSMSLGDTLVVYELRSINKSIVELSDFFQRVKHKGIQLIIIDKGDIFNEIKDEIFMDMVLELSRTQKVIARERTKRGLDIARQRGNIGGRPKISEDTIDRINYLFYNKKMTLREIADECCVSLGTVYKYVND